MSDAGSATVRDYGRFPKDEIGDKLYQALLRGRSPDEDQDIDFAFLFAKKLDAEAFAERLKDAGEEPEIEHLPEEEGEIEEWEVLITRDMLPVYAHVKAALDELTSLARNHYGKLAYWIP